ncbi:MAG: hypothetical protein L3K10_07695 [Thermoplasmata archaeon]|nr:hypothetical protein [Thermoplasmata archaeon]
MALFSDIDWVILVGVAAFLLFGRGNGEVLRTLGRWYGRAGRIKQDLLSEFTKAADLPISGGLGQLSLRGALLGLDPPVTHVSGIPAAVTSPPALPVTLVSYAAPVPWTGGYPTPTWSMSVGVLPETGEVTR